MDNSSSSTPSQINKKISERSKKQIPKNSPLYKETIISEVLKELQDDVVDSPKCIDTSVETVNQKDGLPFNHNIDQSNNIFIQQRNSFKQIPKVFSASSAASVSNHSTTGRNSHSCGDCTYIWIALNVQSWIRTFYTFIHGITAGLAMAYIILVTSINMDVESFYETYPNLTLMILSFFDFLTIICIVSVFDKIDPLHAMSKEDTRPEPIIRKWFNYLSLLCYLLTLLLHQISIPFENILIQNDEDSEQRNKLLKMIHQHQINEWYHLSIFKSLFLFVGWMLIAIYPTQEGVKRNFKILSKYCRDFKENKKNRYW